MKTPQHKLESYKKAQEKWSKKNPDYKNKYYHSHKELSLMRQKRWYEKNRERILAENKKKRKLNPGQSKANKKWHLKNQRYNKQNRDKIKLEVMTHYSNGTPRCCVCGYDNLISLDIDHINNDGKKDRDSKNLGSRMYCWLKKNNYPPQFQVLCKNHNWEKHIKRIKKAKH